MMPLRHSLHCLVVLSFIHGSAFSGSLVSPSQRLPAKILASAPAFDPRYDVSNVQDRDPATEYASHEAGTGTFIVFDFGKEVQIGVFLHEDRHLMDTDPNDWVVGSRLIFSNDPRLTKTLGTVEIKHVKRVGPVAYTFAPQHGRYVRWQVTDIGASPKKNHGAREIAFFGPLAKGAQPQEAGLTIHVSPSGNDGWSGRLSAPNADRTDGPLANLAMACEVIRCERYYREAIRVDAGAGRLPDVPLGKHTPTVLVHGGKFYLRDTLRLRPEDSGLVIRAADGQQPVLSGGMRLTGWKPYRGRILQCDVPESLGGRWKFRQFYLDGKSLVRARFPDRDRTNPRYGGWLAAKGPIPGLSPLDGLVYRDGTLPRTWGKPQLGEVFVWLQSNAICSLASIAARNEPARSLRFDYKPQDWNISPWFYPNGIQPGARFRVENLIEELDQPGEWCSDWETGKVYLWPPEGVDLQRAEVVAPNVQTLVEIKGVKPNYLAWSTAKNITLRGLTFTETQGGETMHRTELYGLGGQVAQRGERYCGEAVLLWGTERCIVEDCRFTNLGGNGVNLVQFNKRNTIRRNEIRDGAFCGVVLAGGRVLNALQVWPEHPLFTEVTDNTIHDVGQQDRWSAGVYLGLSEANDVAHNLIYNLPHHAICYGSAGWGRNYIEYNRIHHVCLETADNGAINGWMEEPSPQAERTGHYIRYNYISDVGNPGSQFTSGVYLDNDSSNCLVYGNVLARIPIGVVVKGKNNVLENNVFYDIHNPAATAVFFIGSFSFPLGNCLMLSHRCERNIFCRASRFVAADQAWERGIQSFGHNVYFNDDKPLGFSCGDGDIQGVEAWRSKTGFDVHSIAADPLLVAPEKDDFRLQPDSPALRLGFVPIDTSRTGPRVDGVQ